MGEVHLEFAQFGLSVLGFEGILESCGEGVFEDVPNDREVVVDDVEGVQPVAHVAFPSCDLVSFQKGEGDGDLSNRGFESGYANICPKVCAQCVDEVVHLGAISLEGSRKVSELSDVASSRGNGELRRGRGLAGRWTASTSAAASSSSSREERGVLHQGVGIPERVRKLVEELHGLGLQVQGGLDPDEPRSPTPEDWLMAGVWVIVWALLVPIVGRCISWGCSCRVG
jgi:hypothetical protein